MARSRPSEQLLIREIRSGNRQAWDDLIRQYEGRLSAFVMNRVRNRHEAEDIVQDTFIGFLTSLPNYDGRRPLESYLFKIASNKLTDYLRRRGRRPMLSLESQFSESQGWEVSGSARAASALYRSRERRELEEDALADVLSQVIDHWRNRGDWQKIKAVELLFVRGWANKEAAEFLGVGEQAIANWKFDFAAKLKAAVKAKNLPADVFPELSRT
ncbi:sigma-70 family RNA polymerase sigma factor [Thermostilla marina]